MDMPEYVEIHANNLKANPDQPAQQFRASRGRLGTWQENDLNVLIGGRPEPRKFRVLSCSIRAKLDDRTRDLWPTEIGVPSNSEAKSP